MTDDNPDTTVESILSIKGRDFDPVRVDAALSIAPTRVWRQHHAHLLARQDLPNVAWQFRVGPGPFRSIEEPTCTLLDRFHPLADVLEKLVRELDAQVSLECVAIVRSSPPAYVLTARSMRRMADLNLDFGLAIFDRRG